MIDKTQAQQNGFKTINNNEVLTSEKNQKLEQLKKFIPNLVNSDNQLDTKALQDFIDIAQTTSNNKGYELTFAGKGIARAKADSETNFELKFEPSQSKNADIVGTDLCVCPDKNRQTNQNEQGQTHRFVPTENVVIKGDNLEVLKILKQNYFSKIKMIYIDPPYNTKSENFIYNDNFKKSESDLLRTYGLGEEEDKDTLNFLHNVYGTRSHSGWLSFMYPRLKLARDLLKEDGVIFISIDDNEQANLKIMCDEIFGEENFVNNFIWINNSAGRQIQRIGAATTKEQIFCYAKNNNYINEFMINGVFGKKIMPDIYKGFDFDIKQDEIGEYITTHELNNGNNAFNESTRPKLVFDIFYNPQTKKVQTGKINSEIPKGFFRIPPKRITNSNNKYYAWRWSESKVKNESNNLEFLEKNGKWVVFTKRRGFEKTTLKDLITNISTNRGTNDLKELEFKNIFDYPKPTSLIKIFGKIATKPNSIILDFFAGSGTTGDAVMQLNAEDGGNRKFILVQWDEEIDKKKNAEAYKFCIENNFKPVISSITLERLNRAGDKIVGTSLKPVPTENQKPLFEIGTFKNKSVDIGYKVFSLTEKPKIIEAKDENQKEIFKVVNERTETINTLINMMCATCKTLDSKIEELIKDKLYKVENEIYLLAEIDATKLEPYKDLKINIDGWSNISLENWLNLEVGQKENITVVY